MSPFSGLPWLFNLDGTFLGFVGADSTTAKAIYLDVEGEVLTIKLPKKGRTTLRSHLKPGDYLRCLGRTKLDGSTIKLKAYHILTFPPLPNSTDGHFSPTLSGADPLCKRTAVRHPSLSSQPTPLSPPSLKIQVCRKSGCQKRGGRELVEALQQALHDRNLHSQVEIQHTGCQKRCSEAPTFTILPGGYRYSRVKLSHLPEMLDRHFAPTKPTRPDPM
ncbi:(2Fe-2S) ferredoxin domain-containing protein [Thermoleptolyngbya sp. M55_K2018_002]|uniref:(2Fe-2S) ferredoxin domain-containing protein n=1 Tax=Thermoleptolyngbya sp. M55_K2018_002 TaxID=2747808 RepID=UPI0019DEB683|nr:(2Fe-2S) ferredoxin domain-containing protein [Thermoleptolyngbya sp. M55_K2018_002]HIK39874.1 (2Fe-2S) ferredoxin domain-containing protein [Thermoleptolyngbya sp. M55_K2018_002]